MAAGMPLSKPLIIQIALIGVLAYIVLSTSYLSGSSLTSCWPQDMVRCKFLDVHSGDRIVLSIEAQSGREFLSLVDNWPKVYLSKKAGTSFSLLNNYPVLCRLVVTDISENSLYAELSCDKNLSQQLDDLGADALIVSWNVRMSQGQSVFNEIGNNLARLYSKDGRSCNKAGSSLVCEVTIGATTYFG